MLPVTPAFVRRSSAGCASRPCCEGPGPAARQRPSTAEARRVDRHLHRSGPRDRRRARRARRARYSLLDHRLRAGPHQGAAHYDLERAAAQRPAGAELQLRRQLLPYRHPRLRDRDDDELPPRRPPSHHAHRHPVREQGAGRGAENEDPSVDGNRPFNGPKFEANADVDYAFPWVLASESMPASFTSAAGNSLRRTR